MSELNRDSFKLVECPRDAWQGLSPFIPTDLKAAYIQTLLKVGFDTIDAGSFVSPRAVPQVSDTAALLEKLNPTPDGTRLLVIIANLQGAQQACAQEKVTFLGYPFSISETFQQRNANSTIEESFRRVRSIRDLCSDRAKELVIYISMGFGNPYGEQWTPELVSEWVFNLSELGIKTFSIADTVGVANPEDIRTVFTRLRSDHPELVFGAHLHARPDQWKKKVQAAFESGCNRFDGTVRGFGGCPFAQDDLVANVATENLISFAEKTGIRMTLNRDALLEAQIIFQRIISAENLKH